MDALLQATDPWRSITIAHSAAIDASLGFPTGSIAAAATASIAVLTLVFCTRVCSRKGKAAKAERRRKRTVLLVGPVGSGKTLMLHQLMFGSEVDTVMSMQPNAINQHLAGAGTDDPVVNLVDFPGAGQLRDALLRAAVDAGALVVVIDACGDLGHVSSAAGLLYDVMTNRAASGQANPPPMLIVANKTDKTGARSVAALQKELEADLERLKVSRAAVVTHQSDSTDGGEASEPLLLGTTGARFSFKADAPAGMQVAWCTASSKGSKSNLDVVRSFILEAVA